MTERGTELPLHLAPGEKVLIEATVRKMSANGQYVTVDLPAYGLNPVEMPVGIQLGAVRRAEQSEDAPSGVTGDISELLFIQAAANVMKYRNLDTNTLRAFCAEIGVEILTRPRPTEQAFPSPSFFPLHDDTIEKFQRCFRLRVSELERERDAWRTVDAPKPVAVTNMQIEFEAMKRAFGDVYDQRKTEYVRGLVRDVRG